MKNTNEDFILRFDFLDFVSREFDRTVQHATVEDMAVFAFGSLEDAIKSFIENGEINNETV